MDRSGAGRSDTRKAGAGRWGRGTALAALAALTITGCTSQSEPAATEAESTSAEATSTSSPAPQPRHISLAFGGDVMFEQHLQPLTVPGALDELRSSLGAADLAVVNLETAVTERGTPFPGKPFTFRTPASAIDSLASAGVDAITMANNHAFDWGEEGMADTFAAKDAAPIPVVGIGRNADEAFAPVTLEANGVRVGLLGVSEVIEETLLYNAAADDKPGIATAFPSRDRILRAIEETKKDHDLVVVMAHWGIEGEHCPGERAIQSAQAFTDAGADIVIGGHAHRLNGQGWLDDSYVHYGMGNFVYYLNRGEAGQTGVLTLDVELPAEGKPVIEREWTQMFIGGDGIPRPAEGVDEYQYSECIPARTDGPGPYERVEIVDESQGSDAVDAYGVPVNPQ